MVSLTVSIFAFLPGSRYIRRVKFPCVQRFRRAIARIPTARTAMKNASHV
jgi:hypothetical protein